MAATAVKEHPVLFKGEMVRALLREANPKSQTRRVITRRNSTVDGEGWNEKLWATLDFSDAFVDPGGTGLFGPGPYLQVARPFDHFGERADTRHRVRPRWKVGDRLWVKETWAQLCDEHDPELPWCDLCRWEYRADLPPGCTDGPGGWPRDESRGDPEAPKWHPSIFMSRKASRITLEVTDVRVERVQDITKEGVDAEGTPGKISGKYQCRQCNGSGCNHTYPNGCPHCEPVGSGLNHTGWFRDLWNPINKKRGFGWDVNPWVWVTSFKRGS